MLVITHISETLQRINGFGCGGKNSAPMTTNYDTFSTYNECLGELDIAGEFSVDSLPVGKIKQQKTKTHNYTPTEEQGRQGSVNALETETLLEFFPYTNCLHEKKCLGNNNYFSVETLEINLILRVGRKLFTPPFPSFQPIQNYSEEVTK